MPRLYFRTSLSISALDAEFTNRITMANVNGNHLINVCGRVGPISWDAPNMEGESRFSHHMNIARLLYESADITYIPIVLEIGEASSTTNRVIAVSRENVNLRLVFTRNEDGELLEEVR